MSDTARTQSAQLEQISRRLAQLDPDKQRSFLQQIAGRGIDVTMLPVARLGLTTAPLSFAQSRFWFLWRMDPASGAYNVPAALSLNGPLDRPALQAAFDRLIERHESLRTVFAQGDAAPEQHVLPPFPVTIRPVHLGDGAADSDIQALAREEAAAPFDLETGPLLRVTLIERGPEAHVLLVTLHHIVCDGWSMGVIVDEFWQFYSAAACGARDTLPEARIQSTDYGAWQRLRLASSEGERQLAYWTRQLGDAAEPLQLPFDRLRLPEPDYRGAGHTVTLAPDLAASLRRLARESRTTPFSVLLAGFTILLHRYSGQTDIRVGVPMANRGRDETRGLVGPLANTVVLRADIEGRDRAADLLARLHATVLEAQDHQDLPFERLVETLHPERSLSEHPLFAVLFNHQHQPRERASAPAALRVEPLNVDFEAAKFDLSLDTREEADGSITALFTYATSLFDRDTIVGMAAHWVAILHALAQHLDRPVGEIRLSSDSEDSAHGTEIEDAPALPVHLAFAGQARLHPRAEALRCGEDSLSYAELDARANRLAQLLCAEGVGPDTIVAVAMGRSTDLVVALLAVLKAGAAYAPLDPAAPAERLAEILTRSGAALCLTDPATRDRLSAPGCPCLVPAEIDLEAWPETDPGRAIHPEALAYVIHTSGSTGTPKGVAVAHGPFAMHCRATAALYEMGPDSRELLFLSFAFDGAHERLWTTLTVGGSLVLRDDALWSPEQTLAVLGRERCTHADLPPAYLRELAAFAAWRGEGTALRVCSFGGEAMPAAALAPIASALSPRILINGYGPTETVVTPLVWKAAASGDLSCAGASAPIGAAVGARRAFVLDADGQPVPDGVVGELFVAGYGLARGYLGRPGATAERFLPDPFGAPGGRMYRTGDRACRRAGTMRYRGRADDQVKIRGHRIEPGEVEARLLALPGVTAAAVIARPGPAGPRLIAYAVTEEAAGTDEGVARGEALRADLARVLPDYMVPARVIRLERLPLGLNGKLDRRALPEPEPERQEDGSGEDAPASEAESVLAGIWAEVLGLERVGRRDDFFARGGDSIVSLQVVSRARRAGLLLEPRDLFRHRSLAALAAAARPLASGEPTGEPASGADEPETGPLPLLPIQAAFFAQAMPARDHWNQAVLLVPHRLPGWPVIARALDALVARHPALRTRFSPDADAPRGWRAEILPPPADPLRLVLARAEDAREVSARCAEAQAGLDIRAGRLLRGLGLDLPDGSRRLLLAIHHLAVDGVSWRLLLEDLATACARLGRGEAEAFPPEDRAEGRAARGGPAAWARRLSACAGTRALGDELGFWRAQTGADRQAVSLPCDREPDAPETMAEAEEVLFALDPAETEALFGRAPSAYRSQANDLLLAALVRAVGRWRRTWPGRTWPGRAEASDEPQDLLIELEGHGREDLTDAEAELGLSPLDPSRVVGWLTSAFPVRLPSDPGSLPDLIKAVKERLRAIPRRGLGYGVLAHLGPPEIRAALAGGPEPSLVFNYLGRFDASVGGQAPFTLAPESAGPALAASSPLGRPLALNASIRAGRLQVSLTYGRRRYERASVERLAGLYGAALREVSAHCTGGAAGLTPSDVPLCRLDQAGLDGLGLDWAGIEDLYPLTPMQQGILFHALEAGGEGPVAGVYLNQLAATVSGLDGAALRAAWAAVSRRHAVLRTGFVRAGVPATVPGGALQVVYRDPPLPFVQEDWRGRTLTRGEEAERLRALAAAERAAGFVPERAPLQRVRLVRLDDGPGGEARHRLIWTSHHILLDGWSSARLLAEVLGHLRGLSGSEPGPAASYRDYVAWLAARQTGDAAAAAEAFWRAELAGLDAPTRLSEAFDGDEDGTDERADGETHEVILDLDAAALAPVRAFARAEGLTLNTLVQGAWALLLHRFTGQERVCFGATVSGRPAELAGAETMLGLFINTLPLRAAPHPDRAAGAWLRALQEHNLALREHGHVPLSRLQRWAGWPGQALFDTLLVFENYPVDEALRGGEGPRFGAVEGVESANYPLMLTVSAGQGLRLHLHGQAGFGQAGFGQSGFGPARLSDLAGTLAGLIRALAEDAARPLGAIPTTRAPAPALEEGPLPDEPALPVHLAFAGQARLHPRAEALRCGEDSLSYAELDARANRLARALRAAGVGPGARVGIALPRGPALLVALLAVLKAGAAYLPLDPEHPPRRLAPILAEAAPRPILVQDGEEGGLAGAGRDLMRLDRAGAPRGAVPDGPFEAGAVDGEALAYVIYTSGSTGTPKGVMLPHRAVSNILASMARRPGMTASDTVLALTALSFDIAVLELLLPLTLGARIVLAGRDVARDPQALKALARRHGVDVIQATPSTWRMLAASEGGLDGGEGLPPGCRRWSGGEALAPDLARLLAGAGAGEGDGVGAPTRAWNLYGPTETCIWSACAGLDPAGPPTLGRPVAATALRVLDPELHPAPAGIRGELFIGGAGLARGYLGRPGLTAARFLPDPFGPPGARLYRTGDLACLGGDGALRYRGRADDQVKIRGHRIEPGEVEAGLLALPGVGAAAVIARPGPSGLRLLGYAVAAEGACLDGSVLRGSLAEVLPGPMVPAAIRVLDRLPLTPNGKLDRRALPDPGPEEGAAAADAAPSTATERALAAIWSQTLGQAGIARTDSFFDIGGDSISAMIVVNRAREAGLDLKPRDLFRYPRLDGLAAIARPLAVRGEETSAERDFGALSGLGRNELAAMGLDATALEDVYPLSPMQQGMLFHAVQQAGDGGDYVNQVRVTVHGLDGGRLRSAWEALCARHAILRTGFLWRRVEGAAQQAVHRRLPLPFTEEDWRGEPDQGGRLTQAAEADHALGFDLSDPPLHRIRLIRLDDAGDGTARHRLIWTYHHILLDGWSSARLVSELLRLYEGQPPVATPRPYSDHIAWIAGRDASAGEAFWRKRLAALEAPTRLADAFGKARSATGGGPVRHARRYSHLDEARTAQLRAFARAERITLNTLVQGAWTLLLQRYTGQAHVCFGVTVSGRPAEVPGSQEMVGLFINTLPVVEARPSGVHVGDWLRAIQERNLDMREHEQTPLADIQGWAGQAGQALFDSIVVFENYPLERNLKQRDGAALRFDGFDATDVTNYPMDLSVMADRTIDIEYLYLLNHFSDAEAEAIRDSFEHLLFGLAEDGGGIVCRLDLASPADRRLARLCNGRAVPTPSLPLVHEAIAEQARQRPEAVALVAGERSLTYGALDRRANRLAHRLIEAGIGPETAVGIVVAREIDTFVAMLAVMKAGAAYVPLDPKNPSERLAFMVGDAGIRLVLAGAGLSLPPEIPTLSLDRLDPGEGSEAPVSGTPHARSLAYVIYTSGSTGQPKGVAVEHGPLSMHCRATGALYEIDPSACELHVLSLAFDGAHERWLTVLSHGARLVVSDETLWAPERIVETIRQEGVTHLGMPPAYLQQLAEWVEHSGETPPVRLYSFGGEAMPKAGFDRIARVLKPDLLINGYGPTETVVTPLVWKVAGSAACAAAYAPIGVPVGTRTAHIVDANMDLVPAGIAGELHIGGSGLARGYHRRPAATAERFVPDPDGEPGARLYRTGDLTRWDESGTVEYLGRVDDQVKIRGYRIELGEVEARLREQPGVRAAAVVAREAPEGSRLVAYVAPWEEAGAESLPATVTDGLRACLPDYMVPARIVVLPRLPLTGTGKIDRRALPEPDWQSDTYVAPETEAEKALARIWRDVLKIERVGVTDDFFALGGNSLLSLQVVSRLRRENLGMETLGVDIKLRDLMRRPTIAQLLASARPTAAPMRAPVKEPA